MRIAITDDTAAYRVQLEDYLKRYFEVIILFVTNQPQHAIQGYEVDAMDYILKSIGYFAFSRRLNRAVSRGSRREEPCLSKYHVFLDGPGAY